MVVVGWGAAMKSAVTFAELSAYKKTKFASESVCVRLADSLAHFDWDLRSAVATDRPTVAVLVVVGGFVDVPLDD